ncbi:MAG TPA: ornithine cyclodeaminase family protein [Kofleriaceae bacterium]|nr:ornithine cyclodeaminase family protein [Kofleriaceae bacterium]
MHHVGGWETLIVTRDDVAAIVEAVGHDRLMDEMIAELGRALAQFDGVTGMRARDGFVIGASRAGVLEWMPILGADSALIKLVSYVPDNPGDRDLPTIVATLCLFDTTTGHLVALADGVVATAIRTGAVSALASRALARPDSTTVGLVGCGAQAVTQLHAISRLFRLERALVHDIEAEVARSFVARTAFLGLEVEVAPLDRVEREADILVTATSVAPGAGPVIRGGELRPAVHINAVGSDLAGKTELPLAVLERALVCPDYLEQAIREGECQQLSAAQIGPSLSEVLRRPDDHASWRERTTVFDSTGFALEDHVAMTIMLGHARALGLGTSLPIEYLAEDPQNPYSPPRLRAAGRKPAVLDAVAGRRTVRL